MSVEKPLREGVLGWHTDRLVFPIMMAPALSSYMEVILLDVKYSRYFNGFWQTLTRSTIGEFPLGLASRSAKLPQVVPIPSAGSVLKRSCQNCKSHNSP